MASTFGQRAVLYAAKSTEDSRGSIPSQLADGRKFAREEGLEVVAEYSEQEVSAYKGNRGPELAAALEHVERIKGVLVAQHSDRLARGDGKRARHLVEIALWARKVGVEICCVQDLSTFENVVLAAMMGERNMEDSRRKSAAVVAGMARRRASGRPLGGRSIGFTWKRNSNDEREIVPDPKTVPIVRRIYAEYLAGRPQLQIARALNADEIPTVRGGKWKPEVIRTILKNPLYAGLIRDGDELIEGRHEPLVSRKEWEEAQRLRSAEKKVRRGGRPPLGRHLFRKGFLRCGLCGETMYTRTERNGDGSFYETYRCHGHYLDPDSCPMVPQRRQPIDDAVFAYFEQVGIDQEATRQYLSEAVERRRAEVQALLSGAEAEAEAAAARLVRVKGHFVGGELTVEEWRELRGDLEPEAEAAAAERDRLELQLATVKAGPDVSAAEAELQDQLARVCAAVRAGVEEEPGIEAVRAALGQLFDCFLIHSGTPEGSSAELVAEGYWIEPKIGERAVEGYEEKLQPVLVSGAGTAPPASTG
jgi:DNA invertase Pin-like site-specific DNA recombinase